MRSNYTEIEMKKYQWIWIITAICFIAMIPGCKIMEEFKIDDFSIFDDDNSYVGIDGVRIDEYTKDGVVVRMFCNEETGLIKLKMGAAVEDVKDLDSTENIKKAMKMPESDYMHLGGGFVDMVITIGTGPKGHTMNMHGIGIYVVGSEDTKEDLDKLQNIDFFYTPCSYNAAKPKDETSDLERLEQLEKRQQEIEDELTQMKNRINSNRRPHDSTSDPNRNRRLLRRPSDSDLLLDVDAKPSAEERLEAAKQAVKETEERVKQAEEKARLEAEEKAKQDNTKADSGSSKTRSKSSTKKSRPRDSNRKMKDPFELGDQYLPF